MNWFLVILLSAMVFVGCSTGEKSESERNAVADEAEGSDSEATDPTERTEPIATPKSDVSNYDLYKNYKEARISKNMTKAQQFAAEILARNPNDPKILNALSTTAIEQGKYDLARLMLGKVLSRDPNNAAAYNNLGVIELKNDNLRLALINFKRATSLDSRNKAAMANLGSIYVQYRNYGAAVAALEGAVDNGDNDVDTLNNYAIALSGNGDTDRATKMFERALAKDQNNVSVMVNYAAHLIDRAKDNKKALMMLNKVRFIAHEPAILERVNSLTRKAETTTTAKP